MTTLGRKRSCQAAEIYVNQTNQTSKNYASKIHEGLQLTQDSIKGIFLAMLVLSVCFRVNSFDISMNPYEVFLHSKSFTISDVYFRRSR